MPQAVICGPFVATSGTSHPIPSVTEAWGKALGWPPCGAKRVTGKAGDGTRLGDERLAS